MMKFGNKTYQSETLKFSKLNLKLKKNIHRCYADIVPY